MCAGLGQQRVNGEVLTPVTVNTRVGPLPPDGLCLPAALPSALPHTPVQPKLLGFELLCPFGALGLVLTELLPKSWEFCHLQSSSQLAFCHEWLSQKPVPCKLESQHSVGNHERLSVVVSLES